MSYRKSSAFRARFRRWPGSGADPPRDTGRTASRWLLTSAVLSLAFAAGGRSIELELRAVRVELPGAPSTILTADLDGDGVQDLVVMVAYTEWDQIGIEERAEMDEVDGLVEVLTIVPALSDRREIYFLRGNAGGGYDHDATLPVDRTVLSLLRGPPGLPIVALTDGGLAALAWREAGLLALEPVIAERPVLAGTGTFVPNLDLLHDLDGDGLEDLLLPAADRLSTYLAGDRGLRSPSAGAVLLPLDDHPGSPRVRHYPLPEVRDVDGDRRPDLLMPHPERGWGRFRVFRNAGGGRFREAGRPLAGGRPEPAQESMPAPAPRETDGSQAANATELVFFGDLDGDGVAEYVSQKTLADGNAGWRRELREAKNPPFLYRLHRSRPDLTLEPEPYLEFETVGYAFEAGDGDDLRILGGFQDLDGDRRLDLVAVTLDFSIFQAVRILTTHSLSIGLDFHVWCQQHDGGFRKVEGLDLSGKFRLDLDNLRLGRLAQFAGDFDGDGRADFVQMGRGRKVTIHRGREGCFYPPEPDLAVELADAPRDLALAQVRDLDGDGLTDLLVIQPQKVEDPGVTRPVRLDLYLSGGRG